MNYKVRYISLLENISSELVQNFFLQKLFPIYMFIQDLLA